jgi:hypothetical protein
MEVNMRNQNDQANRFVKGKKRHFLSVVTIMVLLAILSSCVTRTPESGKPEGAEECPGESEPGTFTCLSLSGNEITLTNVPDKVLPNRLPLSDGQAEELRQAEKEGTECIFAVAADLAFYDTDDNLVTEFSGSTVTITYTFSEDELDEFEVCKATLVEQNLVADPAEVQFVPVYFSDNTWKPFPDGSYTIEENTVNVRITSWGDLPWGGGTRP